MKLHRSQQVTIQAKQPAKTAKKNKSSDGSVQVLRGRKNIPEPKLSKDRPVDLLQFRSIKHSNISFSRSEMDDRDQIAKRLLFHWTGKDLTSMTDKEKKAVEKLNSSAMMAFAELIKEGNQLTTSSLPHCLICSDGDHDFEKSVQEALRRVTHNDATLFLAMKCSQGLYKTPVIIARLPEQGVMAEDELQPVGKNSGVIYCPRIEAGETSSASGTTLFLSGEIDSNKNALVTGLADGLRQGVIRAEKLLPEGSRHTAKWLMTPSTEKKV